MTKTSNGATKLAHVSIFVTYLLLLNKVNTVMYGRVGGRNGSPGMLVPAAFRKDKIGGGLKLKKW